MNDALYGFMTWFKAFFGYMLDGFLMIFKGLVFGIGKIFDFPYYFRLWSQESVNFTAGQIIFCGYNSVLCFSRADRDLFDRQSRKCIFLIA